MRAVHYYKDYFLYVALLIGIWWITGQVIALVPGEGLLYVVICAVACLIVPNTLLLILFCKSEGFAFLMTTAKRITKRLLRK